MKWLQFTLIGVLMVGLGVYALTETIVPQNENKEVLQSFNTLSEPVNITVNNTDGYLYKTTGTSYTAYFKEYSNWGDGVKYCVDVNGTQKCLIYQPQDMSYRDVYGGQDYIGSIGNSQAQLINNTIKYLGIFSNVDLTYTVNPNKMKEHFVLNSKPRNPATWLTPPITLDFGGYIKYDNDVKIVVNGQEMGTNFKTKDRIYFKYNNETLFVLDEPNAYDYIGNNSIFLEYEVQKKGNQIWFYVKTPYSYINNSSIQYPIQIDPTVTTTNMTIWFPLNETSGTIADNFGSLDINGTFSSGYYYSFAEDDDGVYRLKVAGYTGSYPNDWQMTASTSNKIRVYSGEDMSFCAVLKLDSGVPSGRSEMWAWRLNDASQDRLIYNTANKYRFLWYDTWLYTNSTVSAGEIYHYCFVFDNSANTGTIYLNGTMNAYSTSFTNDYGSDSSIFNLGHYDFDVSRMWNGTIGNVRFWNGYALSSSEVADVFNTDLNVSGGSPPAETPNWVDCTSNPATNESKEYNSSFFVNGTGNWSIAHDITLNSFNFTDTCGLIVHNSGSLTLK